MLMGCSAHARAHRGSTPWYKQEALGLHETPPKPEGWEINDLDSGEIFADAINMRGVALYRGHRRFTGTALMVSMPHRVGCCVLAALAVCVCVLTKASAMMTCGTARGRVGPRPPGEVLDDASRR